MSLPKPLIRGAEFHSAVPPIFNRQGTKAREGRLPQLSKKPAQTQQSGTLRYGRVKLCVTFAVFLTFRVIAAEPTPAQLQFFENHIRPVLAENCYKCHSQQAEKVKGGLLLDTREGVLKGGDTGPAIV